VARQPDSMREPRCLLSEDRFRGHLTSSEVRDLVVDCFTDTHRVRFSSSRGELGMDAGSRAVRGSMERLVRLAFSQVGGDYDLPTRHHLARVIDLLAERSLDWGIEPDVVFERHSLMTRAMGRVPDRPNWKN